MKIIFYTVLFLPILMQGQTKEKVDLNYNTNSKLEYELTIARDNELLRKERKIGEDSLLTKNGTIIFGTTKDKKLSVYVKPTRDDIEITMIENIQRTCNGAEDSIQNFRDTSNPTISKWLEAKVDKKGRLTSFYRNQEIKDLVSLLFSLPLDKVTLGSSWEIPVNLLQVGPNFNVEKASKFNQAKLEDVFQETGDKIAVISFRIEERVEGVLVSENKKKENGTRKVIYEGDGKFNISLGRWNQLNTVKTEYSNLSLYFPEDITKYKLKLIK